MLEDMQVHIVVHAGAYTGTHMGTMQTHTVDCK